MGTLTAIDSTVDHTWNTVGTYQVSLQVTDNDGQTATTSTTVNVVPPACDITVPSASSLPQSPVTCPSPFTQTVGRWADEDYDQHHGKIKDFGCALTTLANAINDSMQGTYLDPLDLNFIM